MLAKSQADGGPQPKGAKARSASSRKPTGLFLVAPSSVRVGEVFSVGVKILTEPYHTNLTCFETAFPSVRSESGLSVRGIRYMDNVPQRWEGELVVLAEDGLVGPERIELPGDGPYPDLNPRDRRPIRRVGGFKFTSPGVHYLTVREPASGVVRKSNPILVSEAAPKERLFWGDIHFHCLLGDGLRYPEELYHFGKSEAFLDICAHTEHAEFGLTDRQWDYFRAVTNDFHAPHRFVTFVAQEWTCKRCGINNTQYGHHNLYYPGETAPLLSSADPKWGDIEKIYKIAREYGALVVPHHSAASAMGVDWSTGHDPEVERLVEIYSCWGNSERPASQGNPLPISEAQGGEEPGQHVQDALALGRRYGIIASSDTHDGRPGDSLSRFQAEPSNYRHGRAGGLLGVWAEELTRESVFEAMWNRRVFGTTGARILLRFSVDDQPMGSELTRSGPLPIRVEVHSEVPVQKVDLVKNGTDSQSTSPESTDVNWETEDTPGDAAYYYARVTRSDGQMAWSSPIWVNVR